MGQIRLDSQDVTPPTLGHIVNKTPFPPQDKKVPVAHSPWG